MKTINISLPKKMHKDAKSVIASNGYSSMSELVRDGLRAILYPNLTVNGFTPEFEEAVLESAKEPIEQSRTIKNLDDYFKQMRKEIEKEKSQEQRKTSTHDKNQTHRSI